MPLRIRVPRIGLPDTGLPRALSRTFFNAGLWTPAAISTAVWYDAADSSTITLSGSNVTQWNDKSGNANNITQTTAAQRPIYLPAALSGSTAGAGIVFDGVDDNLVFLTTAINNTTHGIYWVFQRNGAGSDTAGGGYRPELGVNTSTGGDAGAIHYIRNDNNFGASYPYFNNAGSYDLSSGTAYVTGVPNVMAFQSNTTGWGVWRNGTIEGTTSALAGASGVMNGLRLAAQQNPIRNSAITISEVILAPNANTTNRQLIEGYLAWKWGTVASLLSTHPYKNAAPTLQAGGTWNRSRIYVRSGNTWSTARVFAGKIQANLWTPAQISTAAWYDASDSSTITLSGSNVTQWNDKSGNGRNVSQAVSSSQPSITTFNGLNALNFDGTNDFLGNTTTSITSGTYNGQFNVFYVATRVGTTGGTILTERSSTLVGTSLFYQVTGIPYISSDGLNVASNNVINTSTFNAFGNAGNIVSHQHVLGSRDNFWLNGTSQTVTAGTASSITGPAGFRVGNREGTVGFPWSGLIMEIIVSLDNLTTTNRQQIEGYLAWKWGLVANLPSDHPYKNSPPTV